MYGYNFVGRNAGHFNFDTTLIVIHFMSPYDLSPSQFRRNEIQSELEDNFHRNTSLNVTLIIRHLSVEIRIK